MKPEEERQLFTDVALIKQAQDASNERMDNLMGLLTPRIEKWDKASVQAGALMRVALTVVSGVIVGGVGFLIFR